MVALISFKKLFFKKPCFHYNIAVSGQIVRSILQCCLNILLKRSNDSISRRRTEKKERLITLRESPFILVQVHQPEVPAHRTCEYFSKYKKNNKENKDQKIRIPGRNNAKKSRGKDDRQNDGFCFSCFYFHPKKISRKEACFWKIEPINVFNYLLEFLVLIFITIIILFISKKYLLINPLKLKALIAFCWIFAGPLGLMCQILLECFWATVWQCGQNFLCSNIFHCNCFVSLGAFCVQHDENNYA